MLALTLAFTLLAQAPQDMKSWVDQDGDPNRPNSYVVSGMPELTTQQAADSAMARAREQWRERLADVGRAYLDKNTPGWLPKFVTGRVLKDWCRDQGRRQNFKILDKDVITRDHAGYKSYQQFLLVQEPKSMARGVPRSLARRLMAARDSFIRRCGAIGALWGMLALAAFWLDRLTRGYMTLRLTFLAVASGVLGPILIMLL